MSTSTNNPPGPRAVDDSWMLERLVLRGVRIAAIVTSDGIAKTWTPPSANTGDVDALAAACSGLMSLANGVSKRFGNGGPVPHLPVPFPGGVLYIRAAADGSHLAVLAEPHLDPGLVAQAMAEQVQSIGKRALSTAPRPAGS